MATSAAPPANMRAADGPNRFAKNEIVFGVTAGPVRRNATAEPGESPLWSSTARTGIAAEAET